MDASAALVFLCAMILFLIFNERKASGGVILPPGSFAWPIVGNLYQIDPKKPHISMAKLAESFGPLISLILKSRLFFIAPSPMAAREILKTFDRELSGRYLPHIVNEMPDAKVSCISVSPECNERWRLLRSIGRAELFSSRTLESHSQTRVNKVNEMLAFLNSKDDQLEKLVDVTVANVLARMWVSQDIVQDWSHSEEMQRTVKRLVDFATPGLVDLYPGLYWLNFLSKRRAKQYREINRTTWGDVPGERKWKPKQDAGIESQDFLDTLIKNSFDDNEVYNFLTETFASSECLTVVIEWAMAELTRNQDALLKLGEELAEAIEGTVLSEQNLTKIPHLQACIKETLRLHPPNPFLLPHSALKACEVMNYGIPKNAAVLVSEYPLGRDLPLTWEDPLSFKPERSLNKSLDIRGTNFEFLPFCGGRRICAGYPLALKHMQLLLVSIVDGFDWSLPPGTKFDIEQAFCTRHAFCSTLCTHDQKNKSGLIGRKTKRKWAQQNLYRKHWILTTRMQINSGN